MNILSNLGITELILILLLALLVVGPERLPELGRKLGTTLRDLRTAYENLTRDLGPELASFQETAQELRDSVDSVRTIPQDMVQKVVKSAELDETLGELKGMRDSVGQMGKTLTDAQKVISNPLNAAVDSARTALTPGKAVTEDGTGNKKTREQEPAGELDVATETAREAAGDTEQRDRTPPGAGTAATAEAEALAGDAASGGEAAAGAEMTADTAAGVAQQEQENLVADSDVPPEQADD